MGPDLAARAELVKLARALGTTVDEVAFAATLPHEDIRDLRERVVAALYDEHRAAFRRVVTIARVLPTAVNVRITLRAFSPLLAARVAGEMTPDRAAELADRMPVEYLAEACVHLDPRRAGPLVRRIRPERALDVVTELIAREEFITLGRLLDTATARIVHDVAATVPTEALLRIGFYAESGAQLTRAVGLLPPDRLRDIVREALTGPPELASAGLALIDRIEDDDLRGRLAEHAAEADDVALTRLLHRAVDDGALPALLVAAASMGETARRRVLTLPALTEPHVVGQLVLAVEKHDLWRAMTPLAALMNEDLRRRFAVARRVDLP